MAKTTKKNAKKKRTRVDRQERFNQILVALWQCGQIGGCSRSDIGRMIELAYSPHLIALIEDMVGQGWVDRSFNPDRPADGYRYFPSQKLENWHKENAPVAS